MSLEYMGLTAGEPLSSVKVDTVFVGSCTNGRIEDLRAAAEIAKGKKVKDGVRAMVVPGSGLVKAQAEEEGLAAIFRDAGFDWREPGCSMCLAMNDDKLTVGERAASTSNRNFEGRVSPDVKANYLASPPLVVAYALAGTVDIDLEKEPVGQDKKGKDVFLHELWPSQEEIQDLIASSMSPKAFIKQYKAANQGPPPWRIISAKKSALFAFQPKSTYIQEPPFFQTMTKDVSPITAVTGARALAILGDSTTTDHISPAGNIKTDSPAGRFLLANKVKQGDFNSYGARRGNDRVMARGTESID